MTKINQINSLISILNVADLKVRIQSTLISKVKKKISPKNRRECDQEITVGEIEKAIKFFENNKSPGDDGLPVEFYKTFNEILKTDLHRLYNEISQLGEMPRSMRQTVIPCLYKEGDKEGITNWRVISLLNYYNEIYTKILANKTKPTLEDIIGLEQTAAIKGRTIIENLQLNREVMSYAKANKTQAAVIALDQEKAFDRVDWNFLFKDLQRFGYGHEIIQRTKKVYQNIETQIKVNGHLSQAFLVKRGLRQGCPLSMILHIVIVEIFLENIRQNNGIKGIVIGKKELKTSAFVDDTTIYIGSNSSLTHLETQLMHFEKATDIKYNKTKFMGKWLGTNKATQENV